MRQLAGLILAMVLLSGCQAGLPLGTGAADQTAPAGRETIAVAAGPTATPVPNPSSTQPPTPATSSSVSVFPDHGLIGSPATVAGHGYRGAAPLTITITNLDTNERGDIGTVQTDSGGNFAVTMVFDHYVSGRPIAPGVFAIGVSNGGSSVGPTAILQLKAPVVDTPTLTVASTRSMPTPVRTSPTAGSTPLGTRGPLVLVAIAAGDAVVRDRPMSSGSNKVDVLAAGETVLLRERSPNGTWFSVVTSRGRVGWVYARLLTIDPAVVGAVPFGADDSAVATPAAPTAPPLPPAVSVPAPPPTPPQPVLLTIGSYTTYASSSVVFVVGEALNTGTRDLEDVNVSASLLTADGGIADRASTNLADVSVAPAHGRFPFMLWFANPHPDWQHIAVEASGSPVSSRVDGVSPYLQLQPRNTGLQGQADGRGYTVAGTIVNSGGQVAEGIAVAVIAYDAAGKVVDVASAGIDVGALAPGASASFTVHLTQARARPARYCVLAQGVSGSTLEGGGG